MPLPHSLIFGCIGVGAVATLLVIASDQKQRNGLFEIATGSTHLARFQRLYLPVFLSAMLADWLQGPFVYALYQGYGIDREHNGYLFVVGFGASALFGTIVGSMADQKGRKKFAMLYCMIYFGHCATKHFKSFGILAFGRFLGGISTSLLFSVFDSWLVSESQKLNFSGEQLGDTFSIAYFGSSIMAIIAGQLGEAAANLAPLTEIGGGMHYGGYISPFDLANCVLVLCGILIFARWSENYGESSGGGAGFKEAFSEIVNNKQVLLCGLIASSFESSMFIFVFNWTPCLMEEGQPTPPFGHIFSCFMILCMLGSRVFAYLSAGILPVETICLLTMGLSAAAHMTVVLTSDVTVRFLAFLVFEACVGLYFPALGALKGEIVPEDKRATIYNLYRLPLNIVVLMPLLLNFSISVTFMVTTSILGVATTAAFFLSKVREDARRLEMQTADSKLELETMVGHTGAGSVRVDGIEDNDKDTVDEFA